MPPQPTQSREDFIKSLYVLEKKDNYDAKPQKRLMAGVSKGVEAIATSYGSCGSNAIIETDLRPFHRITNDGKIILDSIKLGDPVENMGLEILKEITAKSDRESGDGRKTSVLLAGAILREGLKCKESPMELKRSLDECLPIILKSIEYQTKEITPEEIGKVAEISSESAEIGTLYQEIYSQIGKDGIVELDNSNLPHTFYEITEGVKLKGCGFSYPYMANDEKRQIATYKNPYILISKEKITSPSLLDKVMREVSKSGKDELVIFCDEISDQISSMLAYLHHGQTDSGKPITPFKTLVIKAPTLWKDWMFEDFALITGATIINPAEGRSLKNFQFSYLGTCEQISTTKDETVVRGIKDISLHIETLMEKSVKEADSDAKLRACWLSTKAAVVKLGANSESELSHLKGKAQDARNASYLALNGGVVPGGGQCLLKAAKDLPDTIGGKILKSALHAPYSQILENMNLPAGAKFDKDILDPAIVVRNAITNALSVASTVLTTKLSITKQ